MTKKYLRKKRIETFNSSFNLSIKGVDLAPGEWDGYDGKTLTQCKALANQKSAPFFAHTPAVYNWFCKILKPQHFLAPNLTTNQGYGYQLYEKYTPPAVVPAAAVSAAAVPAVPAAPAADDEGSFFTSMPFIIGMVVLLLIIIGVIIFLTMSGNNNSDDEY